MLEFLFVIFMLVLVAYALQYVLAWPIGAVLHLAGVAQPYERARAFVGAMGYVLVFAVLLIVTFLYWKAGIFASWGVAFSNAFYHLGSMFGHLWDFVLLL